MPSPQDLRISQMDCTGLQDGLMQETIHQVERTYQPSKGMNDQGRSSHNQKVTHWKISL